MKRILFAAAAAAIAVTAGINADAQPGNFVRKKLTPNFFIPKSETERQEVLPPFYYEQPQPRKAEKKKEIMKVEQAPETLNSPEIENINSGEIMPPKPFAFDKQTDSKYVNYNRKELAKTPEYQQKYDDYINDLKIIAQTGHYPENQRLYEDLAAMDSNERIVVDDSFGIRPKPSLADKTQKAEIINIYPGSDNPDIKDTSGEESN